MSMKQFKILLHKIQQQRHLHGEKKVSLNEKHDRVLCIKDINVPENMTDLRLNPV